MRVPRVCWSPQRKEPRLWRDGARKSTSRYPVWSQGLSPDGGWGAHHPYQHTQRFAAVAVPAAMRVSARSASAAAIGKRETMQVPQGRCHVTCGGGGFLSDRSNSGPCPKDLPAALWQAECTGPSGCRWSLLTGEAAGAPRDPALRASAYAKPHPGKISFASAGNGSDCNDASRAYARSRPFERTSWNRLAKDGVLIG
jgi:hypothetical protein